MRSWIVFSLAICLLGASLWKSDLESPGRVPLSISSAAEGFLESLKAEQRSKAALPYDAANRIQWHFIPLESRKGLPLMEMTEDQKQRARDLLKAFVSQLGYSKTTQIMSLENVLRKLEGPTSHVRRNPEKYYFTVFGTPSEKGTWGLSVEGHHLSLNFVVSEGHIVDSTPQVFAANPSELKADYGDGFPKGLKVLRAEEESAYALLASLTPEQRKLAVVADQAPAEVRWAGEAQPKLEPAQGIAAGDLKADQQELLRKVIRSYSDSMRDEVSEDRWKLIENSDFQSIRFAWAGPDVPGEGHYYCVQGKTFIIEFVNTQADAAGNPANHIHCIWRDLQGDFHLPIEANTAK